MSSLFIIPVEGPSVLIGDVSASLLAQLGRTKLTDITNEEVPGVASILSQADFTRVPEEQENGMARCIICEVMGVDPGPLDEFHGIVYIQVSKDDSAQAGQPGVSALDGRLSGDGWNGLYFPTDASEAFRAWAEQTHQEAWLTAVPATTTDPTSTSSF